MKDFILPIVALIGGIASLYVDSKDVKKRWLFIAGLLSTAIITIAFNAVDNQAKENEKNEAVRREKEQADKLWKILTNLAENLDEVKTRIEFFTKRGFTPETATLATPQTLATAVSADKKYDSFVNGKLRFSNLNVEYYPKGLDSDTVKKAMETLGFNVHPGPAKNETPTNAIWVGPNVPDEAIQFIGVTLLRAGAKIVRIMRIPNPTGSRASLIQIGAEPALVGMPGLSLEAIEVFSNRQLK